LEDFAQALGLPAALKYERNGREGRRFDAEGIGRLLSATDQPILARQFFLEATLFNLLIGNIDNHAKNHALLYWPGQVAPAIAPLYDLVPVQLAKGFREDFSFTVGSAARANELTREDLFAFATAIGIPASGIANILPTAAQRVIGRLQQLLADCPPEMHALRQLIGQEAARLTALLG
jgi:serine/threonine-protein kinase HipA